MFINRVQRIKESRGRVNLENICSVKSMYKILLLWLQEKFHRRDQMDSDTITVIQQVEDHGERREDHGERREEADIQDGGGTSGQISALQYDQNVDSWKRKTTFQTQSKMHCKR